jgi:cell division septum initiation protein DivIVA
MAKTARPLEWMGYQTIQPLSQDLRSLSAAELEMLAGVTVVAMLQVAHAREEEAEAKAKTLLSEAIAESDRVRSEADKHASATTSAAQKTATTLIRSANEEAENALKKAERHSAEIVADANKQASEILSRAKAESVRIQTEWEKNVRTSSDQMRNALARFSTDVQVQLQMVRQIGLKSAAIESELITARDAISELGATMFSGAEKQSPAND